jgi:ketosteroid isomerase-like protein
VSQRNVEIVQRVFEMFARRGDKRLEEEVLALWHDDARWYPLLLGGGALEGVVYEGHEGVLRFLREQADEGWSEVRSDPVELRELDENRVLAHVHVSAVGAHSGARVGADTWFTFTLRDRKVVEARVFADEAAALADDRQDTVSG